MKTSVIVSLLITGALAANLVSAQSLNAQERSTIAAYEALAMDESDMGDVSGVAGPNVLNIHGSSAAGLMQDIEEPAETEAPLNEWGFQESNNTQTIANKELSDIEKNTQIPEQPDGVQVNETHTVALDSAIKGGTQVFNTSSEISYDKENYHHETKELAGNAISISRDMHIDLLKIENMSGDSFQQERSAGSIYLSDWSSLGSTTLTPR